MLDLDNPRTKHIFAAAGKMDLLRGIGDRMVQLPLGDERHAVLLADGRGILSDLRILTAAHFKAVLPKLTTLTQAEEALEKIAHANDATVVEAGREALVKALEKMESHEGFGTCFI